MTAANVITVAGLIAVSPTRLYGRESVCSAGRGFQNRGDSDEGPSARCERQPLPV